MVDINHVSCFGIYDGSVGVSNVVGAIALIYTWTGPSGYTGSGDYISSLYAGSYAVVLKMLMVVQLLLMLKLNSQSNLSIQHTMLWEKHVTVLMMDKFGLM